MLLLQSNVEEGAITFERSAERAARLIASEAQGACWWRLGERTARVESFILHKSEDIAVPFIRARLGHNVDCSARRAAKLCRQPIVDDLELTDDFRRERNASRARSLIRVVEAINRARAAARCKASKGEDTIGERYAGRGTVSCCLR